MNRYAWMLIALAVCYDARASSALTLDVVLDDDTIEVRLENRGSTPADVSKAYAFSGLNGGNVIALIVTSHGQQMPPCAHVDAFVPFAAPDSLASGGMRTVWKGVARHLVQFHCLEKASYTVAFAYRRPNGDLLFTRSISLDVGADGKAHVRDLPHGGG